jgi:hypothetical protein
MKYNCNICLVSFTQKHSLTTHLTDKRCKGEIAVDLVKLNNFIVEQKKMIDEQQKKIEELSASMNTNITATHSQINQNSNVNNIHMKVEININPISKLETGHIEPNKMIPIIEKYDIKDKTPEHLNILLGDYIKEMICDNQHPENHAVKYIKKRPPTYNSITEDSEGNTVNVIKGLKDTCELLTDPILDKLKIKMKEFISKYKQDTDPEFDYCLYEDAIKELKKELNKANVKKALKSVLRNDILNNIEMKLSLKEFK